MECPFEHHWCDHLAARLDEMEKRLERLFMAAIDDLTAAVSGLSSEITTFLADVAAAISGGVTAEQAESVVGQINAFTAQLQAADPANQTPPAS